MRSAIDTFMVREDEVEFLEFVLQNPSVALIADARFSKPEVSSTRIADDDEVIQYFLWDRELLDEPAVREYAHQGATSYRLDCDDSVLQFLRSRTTNGVLTPGRVAIATEFKYGKPRAPERADALTKWYKSLRSWIKKRYSNRLIYTSDHKPEVGDRVRHIWIGPRAIEAWRMGLKLKVGEAAPFSYQYVDAEDEERVVSRLRDVQRVLATGVVVGIGEREGYKRVYEVRFEKEHPVQSIRAPFSLYRPEPDVGDEVACVLIESVYGEHSGLWEPREIKKLSATNRAKVMSSLKRQWRIP